MPFSYILNTRQLKKGSHPLTGLLMDNKLFIDYHNYYGTIVSQQLSTFSIAQLTIASEAYVRIRR